MGSCMSTFVDGKLVFEEGSISAKLKRKLVASSAIERDPADDGKLCCNGVSNNCSAYSKKGRKGVNQDRFIVWEGFGGADQATFCGVFDGHGPIGHHVAKKVQDRLPNILLDDEHTRLFMISKANIVGGTDMEHSESMMDNSSNTFCPIRNAFMDSYSKMDNELQVDPELNCEFSGTTAITLLVQDKLLVIANVGDSRAILAYREGEDGPLRVKQLTVDFKPDLPGELDRIRNCKGRVFALEDEPDVARVWLPHDDKPGLAMARAFGDFCLKEYGLSAVPHVSCRKVKETDEFVVLATDGVWDVMSNEEVANVVAKTEPKDMAAKKVVDAAVRKWKRNFSHVRMDDIAVVCHFLNQKQGAPLISSDNSQSYSSKTSKELESLNSACHQNSVKMDIVVSSIDKEI